jgi:hypothetical protein
MVTRSSGFLGFLLKVLEYETRMWIREGKRREERGEKRGRKGEEGETSWEEGRTKVTLL